MKIIAIFYFICVQILCIAQPGFNIKSDLNHLGGSFSNIQYYHDTLIISGNVISSDDEGLTYGMLILKADTLGNVLDYQTYYDNQNDPLTQISSNSCIFDLEDRSIACVGQLFWRRNGIFIKTNIDLDLEIFQEYPDSSSVTDIYSNINKIAGGYLVSGLKQEPNGVANIFILKVDKNGNKKWEKKFTTPGMETYINEIWVVNENEYLVAATASSVQGVSLPHMKFSSKIFSIDSLGNIRWQWKSPDGMDEVGARNISKTKDGHWAYFSSRGWYNQEFNEISVQPVFIVRDEQFNLIQYDTFGVADVAYPNNGFNKVIQLADGGWMAVGNKPVEYQRPPYTMGYNALAGWMLRLDSDTNQDWNRVDTAYWDEVRGSRNYLYNVLELPGGSFIACGKSTTYTGGSKDWAWLIKVDKDGCMDTLCTTTSINAFVSQDSKMKVFPNPAIDYVQFSIDGEHDFIDGTIIISDLFGKTLEEVKMSTRQHLYTWDASLYPSGVYLYQVHTKGKLRYIGKIVLQK